jgi:hypothetical protein
VTKQELELKVFIQLMALDVKFKYQIVILTRNVHIQNKIFHISLFQVITNFEMISNNSAHTQHLALQ